MKKIHYLLAILMFALGLVALSPAANAQSGSCGDSTQSETGPNSTNIILCENEDSYVLKCNTNIDVENNNNQNAETGEAVVDKSTKTGEAISGAAENKSEQQAIIDTYCASLVTEETPAPTPTPTPAPTPAPAPAAKPAVAALPNTGTQTLFEKAMTVSAVAIGSAFVILGSALAYKRFNA